MSVCTVPDCDRPVKARGWCSTHYMRWWTHGDPTVILRTLPRVDDYLSEVKYLLAAGEHPARIAERVGVRADAIAKAASRRGDLETASAFLAKRPAERPVKTQTSTMSPLGAWQDQAACRGTESDIFFPDPSDTAGAALAQSICADCPVRAPCAEHALTAPERYGIWGGLTED